MAKYLTYLGLLASALAISACTSTNLQNTPKIGSPEWAQWVESKVQITDKAGHGPDVGEAEWCQAVERKLLNNQSNLEPCSPEWSQKVTDKLNG